jgi:hypothetical protein
MNYPLIKDLLTMKEASDLSGIPYWKIQRAVRRGILPSYSFFNDRKLVRVSDIETLIERSREGGEQ